MRTKVIALVVAIVLLAAAGFAFFYFQNERETVVVAPEESEMVDEGSPSSRDLERYADVTSLKLALAAYYADSLDYPNEIQAIIPKYLPNIPSDPLTEDAYPYIRTEGAYQLSFILEEGVLALAPGAHTLTPNGFDVVPSRPETRTGNTQTAEVIPSPSPVAPESPIPGEPLPPSGIDSDSDGLSDDDERVAGTNPNNADTDGDLLSDLAELQVFGTDPLNVDTDGDSFDDRSELMAGYDPKAPAARLNDADGDGLADSFELHVGTSPANADTDGDGVSDSDEIKSGSDPLARN